MRKRQVRYRVEVNYLSKDYEDAALEISSPIYTKADGWKEYRKSIKKFCVDDKTKPARVWFWKYNYDANGKPDPVTIAKNY